MTPVVLALGIMAVALAIEVTLVRHELRLEQAARVRAQKLLAAQAPPGAPYRSSPGYLACYTVQALPGGGWVACGTSGGRSMGCSPLDALEDLLAAQGERAA